jgi:hypothetical protein
LIVPPLPAASRPSNRITTRWPVSFGPGLQLQQFDLQPVLLLLVVAPQHQVAIRITAIAPVFGQLFVGVGRDSLTGLVALEQGVADQCGVVGRHAPDQFFERLGQGARITSLADHIDNGGRLSLRGRLDRVLDGVGFDRLRVQARRDVTGACGTRARGATAGTRCVGHHRQGSFGGHRSG